MLFYCAYSVCVCVCVFMFLLLLFNMCVCLFIYLLSSPVEGGEGIAKATIPRIMRINCFLCYILSKGWCYIRPPSLAHGYLNCVLLLMLFLLFCCFISVFINLFVALACGKEEGGEWRALLRWQFPNHAY